MNERLRRRVNPELPVVLDSSLLHWLLIFIAFYMYYLYYLHITLFCTFILHLFYIVVSETVLLSAGGLVRSFLQKRFLMSMNLNVLPR